MDQKRGTKLSWIVTALACGYLAWVGYVLIMRVPPLARSLAALGVQVPVTTAFVIASSKPAVMVPVMLLLAGFLMAKEYFVADFGRRIAITVIVFIAISWFRDLAIDAMQTPMLQLIQQLNK